MILCTFSKLSCGSNYQYHHIELPISCTGQGGRLHYIVSKYKKPTFVMVCVACQALLSSALWNFFIFNYHITLETDQYSGDVNINAVVSTQNDILKSSAMWMISYFWRLVNPQTMTKVTWISSTLYALEPLIALNCSVGTIAKLLKYFFLLPDSIVGNPLQ